LRPSEPVTKLANPLTHGDTHGKSSTNTQWIGFVGKIYRKTPYLMGNSMVSGSDFPLNQIIYKYWKNPEIFPQLLEVPRSHFILSEVRRHMKPSMTGTRLSTKPWMTWGSTKHITWGNLHGFFTMDLTIKVHPMTWGNLHGYHH